MQLSAFAPDQPRRDGPSVWDQSGAPLLVVGRLVVLAAAGWILLRPDKLGAWLGPLLRILDHRWASLYPLFCAGFVLRGFLRPAFAVARRVAGVAFRAARYAALALDDVLYCRPYAALRRYGGVSGPAAFALSVSLQAGVFVAAVVWVRQQHVPAAVSAALWGSAPHRSGSPHVYAIRHSR